MQFSEVVSSLDSEFYISDRNEMDELITGVDLELQQAHCDYPGDYVAIKQLAIMYRVYVRSTLN